MRGASLAILLSAATGNAQTPPRDMSPFLLTSPLRLTLQNDIFPVGAAFAGCATHDEPSGNSQGGIPLSFHREVAVTPRLVLAGFSQLGCPIDASIGGMAALVTPVRPALAFVLSGGLILAPAQLPLFGDVTSAVARQLRGQVAPTSAALHADLVWQTRAGALAVGVGSTGRKHLITIGGGW